MMASAAQIEANRLNAAASSSPQTPEGKVRSSQNHLKFGLFSTQNCVRPEATAEYTKLSKAFWKDLDAAGPVEEMLAIEIVRAAWRLHRCDTEAEDGETPATQALVDRSRASAHNSLDRLLNDLRQFQSNRWLVPRSCAKVSTRPPIGIAAAHHAIKGLTANERLKSQSAGQAILSPARSPPERAIRTQSDPSEASPSGPPPGFRPAPFDVVQALSPGSQSQVPTPQPLAPRNAPCAPA